MYYRIKIIYTIFLIITVTFAAAIIWFTRNRKHMPGAKYFTILVQITVLYNAAYLFEINSVSSSAAVVFYYIESHLGILSNYIWFLMSLDYLGVSRKHIRIAKYALLIVPVFMAVSLDTNSMHHLYFSSLIFQCNGYFNVVISEKGSLLTITDIFLLALYTKFVFLYIHRFLKAAKLHRYGYLVMIFAVQIAWSSELLYLLNIDFLYLDFTPVATFISGIFYIFGIFHFNLFHTIPIAAEVVFQRSKDGIMIIDDYNYIISVNDSFYKCYPKRGDPLVGKSFTDFVQMHSEFESFLSGSKNTTYRLFHKGETQYISAEFIPILTDDGIKMGDILTLNDITPFVEQRKGIKSAIKNAEDKAEKNEILYQQSQINPYILDSVLKTIAGTIKKDPHSARELVVELSKYLMDKYYFDKNVTSIPLWKEIESVDTYVAIEQAIAVYNLSYEFICEEIPQIDIPRHILQPLVENIVQCRMFQEPEKRCVFFEIFRVNSWICFLITYNGEFSEFDSLDSLLDESSIGPDRGLLDIHKRLIKHYETGLTFERTANNSTAIYFFIPENHVLTKC